MIDILLGLAGGIGSGILSARYFGSRQVKVLRDEVQRLNRTSIADLRRQILDEIHEEMTRSSRSLFSSVERVTNDLRDEIDRGFGLLNAKVPPSPSEADVKDNTPIEDQKTPVAPRVVPHSPPVDSRVNRPVYSRASVKK